MAIEVSVIDTQQNHENEIRALQTIELALTGRFLLWPSGGKLLQLFEADEEILFDAKLTRVLQNHLVTKPLVFSIGAHRILKRPPYQRSETTPDDLRKKFEFPDGLTDNERVVFVLPGIRDLLTFDREDKLALLQADKKGFMPQETLQLLIESLTPIIQKQIGIENSPAEEKILRYLYVIANTNTNKDIPHEQEVVEITEDKTVQAIPVETRRQVHEDTPLTTEMPPTQPLSVTLIESTESDEIVDTGGIFGDLSEYELDKEFWDIGHENKQLWEKIMTEAKFTENDVTLLSGYFSEDRSVKREDVKKLISRLTQAVALYAE